MEKRKNETRCTADNDFQHHFRSLYVSHPAGSDELL